MRGLKVQNANNEYWKSDDGRAEEKYFELIQTSAKNVGCVFFYDAVVTGRECRTDNVLYLDIRGWLIPEEKADRFESDWYVGKVGDEWTDYIRWAEWKQNPDGSIIVEITDY